MGLADQNSGTDTVAGDALCLFAAIMYVRSAGKMGGGLLSPHMSGVAGREN